MIGWAIAGFLLGFMIGSYYGVKSERRRLVRHVSNNSVRLMEIANRFADKLPQQDKALFTEEAENIVKLDDYRPPKGRRPF